MTYQNSSIGIGEYQRFSEKECLQKIEIQSSQNFSSTSINAYFQLVSDYCFATRSILAFIGHGQPTPSLYRNMKPAVE